MFKKILGATLAATFATGLALSSASAQTNNNQQRFGLFPALLGPVGAAAAVGTSTSTIAWTTVATQTWNFPWHYNTALIPTKVGPFTINVPTINTNIIGQGLNAKGQYWANITNPHYFNETLTITAPNHPLQFPQNTTGEHSTSAQYKQNHSKQTKSKSNMGKAVVACIMGSAFGAITASIRKATALGNSPRWRSQAEHERIVASGIEKKYELTSNEASTALALCGLGSLTLRWPQQPS